MRYLKAFGILAALFAIFLIPAAPANAQGFSVGVGVGPAYVGVAPVCAYGYYPVYPYACAPYGYYGPSWFSGGVFIGAGPWFHGYGYRGGFVGRPGFNGYGHGTGRPAPVFHGLGQRGAAGGFHGGAVAPRGGNGGSHGGGGFHGGGGRR
jgi:hypothetical protein